MPSDRNPFDETKALFTKYERLEVIRPFLVVKLLSMLPATFLLAIQVNDLSNGMPKYLMNYILWHGVPRRKNPGQLRFIKRKKKEEVKLKQKISETFCTAPYHTNQIIDLLRRQGVKPESFYGLKKGK